MSARSYPALVSLGRLSLLPCPFDTLIIAHLGEIVNTFFESFSTFFEGTKDVPLCPRYRRSALYIKGPPPPSLLYHTMSILVKGFLKKFFTNKKGLSPSFTEVHPLAGCFPNRILHRSLHRGSEPFYRSRVEVLRPNHHSYHDSA